MADNPSDLIGKEFIFEYGVDRILPPSDKTGGVFATEQRAHRRERVVRCRDCAYAQNGGTSCLYWSHKESAWSRPVMPDVVPDGFCAWGERRK